ncbi:cellulase family glycosylhydrolase [Streptacidiphilus sp. MAP5-3]|uniref:cellulase family glycosylhydrolase n=1 Tax=unclassified Streptacidiphilus TaxID=2643834 RepID=UPI0035184378
MRRRRRGRLLRLLVTLVVIACAAGLLVHVGTPAAQGVSIAPPFLTDSQGRALILDGLDADGGSAVSSGQAAAAEYNALGDDYARIMLSWSRVEPRPGRYDDAYLAGIVQRIGWYAAQGDHVVLAMEQDAYGLPPGTPVAPATVDAASTQAADEFWGTRGDRPDLQQRYAAAWVHIADYLDQRGMKGVDPILGFDLIDRPWGGSVQGAAFESGPLAHFYQRVIDDIRAVDSERWLFVEPEAVATDWGLPSALPALTDPRSGGARIGYAPQFYPAPLDPSGSYSGTSAFMTDRAAASWQIQVARTAARLDAPVLVGGWTVNSNAVGAHLYVDHTQALFDQMMVGSAYWSAAPGPWSPWAAPGRQADLAGVLQTAYPRAVAGVPVEFDYDKGTLVFTLQFRDAAGVTGSTDVYLPPSDFPNGPQIEFDAACSYTWDPVRHILSLTEKKPVPGTLHTLQLTPSTPTQNVG